MYKDENRYNSPSVLYGTPMVAKFDSLFLVDAENIYSIYCKFYSII